MIGEIISLNVRGVNDQRKREVIRGSILCLQEKIMETLSNREKLVVG